MVDACLGVRVLDLTQVLAGPLCTSILADMGAEVIKVEKPTGGDDSRQFPPFKAGMSFYYGNLNRGKKSIVLNLKRPEGKRLFLKLVKRSDVLVENFTPGTMDKLGLGYEALSQANPKLIYASISTFGAYGSYSNRPGYDVIAQAMGGIMSVTGWPETPPTRTGTAIADVLAGLNCCIGILAALRARGLSGKGQRVDVSLVDSVVSSLESLIMLYTVEGKVPTRIGNKYEFIYPYDTFKARDGWVVIGAANNSIWSRLCEAIGKPDLASNPQFNSNLKRVRRSEEIKRIIEGWSKQKSVKEIVATLISYEVPCSPIYTVKDIVEDKHIAEDRGMIVEVNHPKMGKVKLLGSPIKMSSSKVEVRGFPPALGEHTDQVLTELAGVSKEEIKTLRDKGVIQ